jgi:phytoene synthase
VLRALAGEVLPRGVSGAALAAMAAGWEALLEQPIDADAVARHAERGRALFAAAGQAIGATGDPIEAAGAGWALADLSRHVGDPAVARLAAGQAAPLLDRALAVRWSRRGRALGALAHLARLDLRQPGGAGAARRVWRMLRHRLTGR